MDTALLGAMLGATAFGAVLAWWERGPMEPASARRGQARHLMPWVGLRLLAALVAARGVITVLAWPDGRLLGVLFILFSLPYLFPWAFARLAIARRKLGWAEGMGRLGAAHFNGSALHAGLVARSWAAWLVKDSEALEEATEGLEASFYGPDTIICRAALAQLAGREQAANALLESLGDFDEHGLAAPATKWVRQISSCFPTESQELKVAPSQTQVPEAAHMLLGTGSSALESWRAKWEEQVDIESLLAEVKACLAQLQAGPKPGSTNGRQELDWAAELQAFCTRIQSGAPFPISLEWSTWCELRVRAEAHSGPQGALKLRELWDPASHFALRLWGEPGGRMLAAAVLRWLQSRARVMDDPSRHASASRQLMLAS